MIRLSVIAFIATFFFSACANKGERAKYISKDAVAVVKVNTMQLGKKAAWEKLTNGSFFSDNEKDTTFNLEKTGIEVLSVFYAYGLADQRLHDGMKWILVIPIKDVAKWETFIKEQFKVSTSKQEGDLHFATQEDAVAGWDKNTAIIAFGAARSSNEEGAAILKEEIKKSFALPEDQNITGNKKFMAMEKQSHDISLFLNYELLIESLPQDQMGMAGSIVASQKKYLKDTYVSAGIDFEKGRIIADLQYFANPATMNLVKSLMPDKIDNEMLKRVPAGELNGVLSYHFNPNGIKSLIDTLGYTGLANSQLQDMNLSVEEILNAFTGDFLFTAANLRMENKTATYSFGDDEVTTQTYTAPNADWLLSIKIKDPAAIGKLLQLAVQMNFFKQKATDIYESNGIILSVKNGYAVLSNNENTANAFLNNTAPNNWKLPAELTDNPTGLYVDIANSVKVFPADSMATAEESTLLIQGKDMLDNILAYGGKQKEDHVDAHVELNFKNKEENSLSQLIGFAEKARKVAKSRKLQEPAFQ